MKKKFYLFLTLLWGYSLLPAQSLDIRLVPIKDCETASYCVDLTLVASNENLEMGAASLYLSYNEMAIEFKTYEASAFSSNENCGSLGWEVQQYDAYSIPGAFHLVLQPGLDANNCPSQLSSEGLLIGQLCFDIIQQGGSPELAFDLDKTFFNSYQPNDGSASILINKADIIQASNVLACDCDGAGLPCDDGDIYTSNDQYDIHCNCQGDYLDQDRDAIPDGIDPCLDITYEAEEASISGPEFGNSNSQYYGSGYVEYGRTDNQYVEFQIDIAEAGAYTLGFRYSMDKKDNSYALSIDGVLQENLLYFPETEDKEDWQVSTVDMEFQAGQHHVRLTRPSKNILNLDQLIVSYCSGCELSGQPCDDGDPCTIDDIYDADCNCGGRFIDTDKDQVADICDPNVGDANSMPFETGMIAGIGEEWQRVELEQTYKSMVVIATPHLPNRYVAPVVTRIRNAQGNSFEMKVQNPSSFVRESYNVFYVVAEEGVYDANKDGIKMEVRKDTTFRTSNYITWNSNQEKRSYHQVYNKPVVLGQVMTFNDEKWSVFWASSGDDYKKAPSNMGLAMGKHAGEDFFFNRSSEVIGSIIIEAGTYQVRNKRLEAQLGPEDIRGISRNGSQYDHFNTTAQGAVLSINGMKGKNGAWPVLFGPNPVTDSQLTLIVDEDQIKDKERAHFREEVAFLAFEDLICINDADKDGVCDEEDQCPDSDDLADEDGDQIPDACDECNGLLFGTPCDDGDPCTILDKYNADCDCIGIPFDNDGDGICNWEDQCEGFDDSIDEDQDGIPDACDPNVGDATTFPIETGVVRNVGDEWLRVELERDYKSMVVLASPHATSRELPPVLTRVKNANGSSFELRIQNPSGPVDTTFDVYYTVVNEGVYSLEKDGVKLEARKLPANLTAASGHFGNAYRETRSYLQPYTQPVVLGQVMTYNDKRFSVFLGFK